MKNTFTACLTVLLLASCAAVHEERGDAAPETAFSSVPLTEKVQNMVVAVQSEVAAALPDEIAGMKSAEPMADREKNQKGAGFTRVYTMGDAVATVFIYNNQEFGISDEVNPAAEALMDRHLQEIHSMQDSGLYENVRAGDKKTRDSRWRRVRYQVQEAAVQFTQKGEQKRSFLVLGANKDLMSYVRIRFTYPKSMQSRMSGVQNTFVRTVMSDLHAFAEARKPKAETVE
ncbi:MAG: hypothetical protein ACI4PW_02270 [Alphaproteobacteria bacterium]